MILKINSTRGHTSFNYVIHHEIKNVWHYYKKIYNHISH